MPKKTFIPGKAGVQKTVNNTAKLMEGIEILTNTRVMVGVPSDKNTRREEGPSNAELAYIHDKGAPEANIPARPFMAPGIKDVQSQIVSELLLAGKAAISGAGAPTVKVYLSRVGIIAVRSIKNRITAGIPPPLAPATIAGRIRRIKGKKRKQKIADARAAGTPWSRQSGSEGIFTPLKVTGQLFNAITYVLRDQLRKKFVVNRDIRK